MAYTKYHSNYIKRQIHKRLGGDSVIIERDWVTTRGARQRLGKGQSAIYGDGNFVFSTSNIPNTQRRHVGSTQTSVWTYEDVLNTTGNKPASEKSFKSNDLRDYVYYGSCTEFIRSSLENIIYNFPGRISGTTEDILIKDENGNDDERYYRVDNPFGIDILHTDSSEIELGPYDNDMRFLCLSYDKYEVTGHNVEYVKECIAKDGYWHKYAKITITQENKGTVEIYMCKRDKDVCFISDNTNFRIEPKPEILEEYLKGLTGFESVLLNRDTKPLYSNVLTTPIMGQLSYQYVKRRYTWPSNDGYIQIDTPAYYNFVNKLLEMAEAFDATYCDNLYNRMTHESIKRYDTTFDREHVEGDAEDNIEGGARMEKVIRLMGRVFDEIKLSADGISRTNQISYSNTPTDPDIIDDKLELMGIDALSIIPKFIDEDGKIINLENEAPLAGGDSNIKWYAQEKHENITMNDVDEEFRKRLLLSASYINSHKGTIHGVEMMLGLFGLRKDDDYTIEEKYRVLLDPTKYLYYDWYNTIYSILPYCSFDDDFKEFPSIPLKGVKIGGEHYIIPYFEMDKAYADPFFAFQSNGGWCKGVNIDKPNEYKETINYLPVVSDFNDLLNINANDVKNGDMYYVAKLDSFVNSTNVTDKEQLSNLGHIFQCVDSYNPGIAASWINEGDDKFENRECAEYLKSLVNNNVGNNPHVGFGNYDDGEEFFKNLEQPFKYAMGHHLFGKPYEQAASLTFKFQTMSVSNKLSTAYELKTVRNEKMQVYIEPYLTDGKIFNNTINPADNVNPLDDDVNTPVTLYNDKLFILHFPKLRENRFFQQYFNDTILPYLTQVIPSTAIFQVKWQ